MTHKVFASGAVVAALLVARVSSAQSVQPDSPGWLKDRKYTEGVGIRTGDLELHPGIAGEVGYDSNWFLRSSRQGVENGPPRAPIIPALEFRVTPSFSVSTLGPQRREQDGGTVAPAVAFRASVNATWRAFVGLSSDSTGNSDISQENSGLPSIGAAAALSFNGGHPIGGAVFVSFTRTVQPNQASSDPNLSFNRDDISGGGELSWQPGSGTLDWHLGYQYRATRFEETSAVGFDNGTHEIFTRGRWRFRPRTALLYDASIGFSSYANSDRAAVQGLVNSTPIRTHLGMNGLITNRFALLALVGWGASLYDTSVVPQQPQYDSLMAQAELTWFLAASPGIAARPEVSLALSSISLGYLRDFRNSYLGNFYGTDRGYLRMSYFFAGRALVNLEGGLAAIEYQDMYWIPPAVTMVQLRHAGFTDLRADATLFTEYRFSDTFGLNATLRYTANFSNTHDVLALPPGAGTAAVFDMAWTRFEAFLGARWFM